MTGNDELHLLDTNVVVQYIRGNDLSRLIESRFNLLHRTQPPLISVVSIGELESLARQWNWGPRKRRELEDMLRGLVVVDISSSEVLTAYGEISAWTRETGNTMGQQNDIWIAATARAAQANLITTDRDFEALHPEFIRWSYFAPRQAQ